MEPECVWRSELTRRLEAWWLAEPDRARLVVRRPRDRGGSPPGPIQPRSGEGARVLPADVLPAVRALVDDIGAAPDGQLVVRNFADWVMRFKGLSVAGSEGVFVQLARLSAQYAQDKNSSAVARQLAQLARIGLVPLVHARHRP